MIEAGYGERSITPRRPLELAGVGGAPRAGSVDGAAGGDELKVRAAALRHDAQTLVLLSFDLLYLSRDLCDGLEEWLAENHGIPGENLFPCATHTHGAPLILDVFFDTPTVDGEYLNAVEDAARQALDEALNDFAPASMSYGAAETSLSINRRALRLDRSALKLGLISRQILNRPNASGPVDNNVYSLRLMREAGNGGDIVIVCVGCHPSIMRDNHVSADFPGRIEDQLTQQGATAKVVFVQGFSGDTRARLAEAAPFAVWPPSRLFNWLFDRHRFRKDSDTNDADNVAGRIAEALTTTDYTLISKPNFSACKATASLPLEALAPVSEFEQAAADGKPGDPSARMNRYVFENYNAMSSLAFRLRRWALSDELQIIGFEGEMFSEYAHWLGQDIQNGAVMNIPASCVGGMVGYIPTTASLDLGGYEVDRSRPLFGIPARFSKAAEGELKAAVHALLPSQDSA